MSGTIILAKLEVLGTGGCGIWKEQKGLPICRKTACVRYGQHQRFRCLLSKVMKFRAKCGTQLNQILLANLYRSAERKILVMLDLADQRVFAPYVT